MTDEEIIKLTNDVFEESFELDRDELQPEKNVFNDLGLDSLDTVDLVVALQQKFGVQIRNDERVREIRTLGDIHQFIIEIKKEQDPEG